MSTTDTTQDPVLLIQEKYAFGVVIGCSIFGILWGLVNTLLVSITQTKGLFYIQESLFTYLDFRSKK